MPVALSSRLPEPGGQILDHRHELEPCLVRIEGLEGKPTAPERGRLLDIISTRAWRRCAARAWRACAPQSPSCCPTRTRPTAVSGLSASSAFAAEARPGARDDKDVFRTPRPQPHARARTVGDPATAFAARPPPPRAVSPHLFGLKGGAARAPGRGKRKRGYRQTHVIAFGAKQSRRPRTSGAETWPAMRSSLAVDCQWAEAPRPGSPGPGRRNRVSRAAGGAGGSALPLSDERCA